jgi:predicted NUDIX family NTP pyrophosphohydrolase
VIRSAGLLLYRGSGDNLEVLIAHMGGPFWARKDEAAWTIPKGEYLDAEDPRDAARREFAEELGGPAPDGVTVDLGEIKQSGGKIVTAFAIHGDFDAAHIASNTFSLEWPRGSGTVAEFPEIDRAEWVDLPTARRKLVRAQVEFVDRLLSALD